MTTSLLGSELCSDCYLSPELSLRLSWVPSSSFLASCDVIYLLASLLFLLKHQLLGLFPASSTWRGVEIDDWMSRLESVYRDVESHGKFCVTRPTTLLNWESEISSCKEKTHVCMHTKNIHTEKWQHCAWHKRQADDSVPPFQFSWILKTGNKMGYSKQFCWRKIFWVK